MLRAISWTPRRSPPLVVLSKELVRAGGPVVENLLDRELRNAITSGTDAMVLPDLVALNTPIPHAPDETM